MLIADTGAVFVESGNVLFGVRAPVLPDVNWEMEPPPFAVKAKSPEGVTAICIGLPCVDTAAPFWLRAPVVEFTLS